MVSSITRDKDRIPVVQCVVALTRIWSDAISHGSEQRHGRQSDKDDAANSSRRSVHLHQQTKESGRRAWWRGAGVHRDAAYWATG
jgi:hypothetical protein